MNLLTDWVNSLVCVTKNNGTIQLCLDPKDLNRAIKRPHHCTPTLEDILPKLSDAKYFSIVDARSGYWNIKLDHESSLCTNFNSPHGRHQFLRLPFGLICAQDIFQKSADGGINAKLQTRQEKQKSQYDKTSKPLPVICPDDPVRFLNPHSHKCEPGIVKCHAETPHSYVVDMADGSIRRQPQPHSPYRRKHQLTRKQRHGYKAHTECKRGFSTYVPNNLPSNCSRRCGQRGYPPPTF